MILPLVSIAPNPYNSYFWVPIFVLLGSLMLMFFLGLIVIATYFLLKPKSMKVEVEDEPGTKQTKIPRELGLIMVYLVLFFSTWIMIGSVTWFTSAMFITFALNAKYSIWHFAIPYVLVLLTLPYTTIACLKTWSSIKRSQGDEKKLLIEHKQIYLLVQLFFSAVFFLLFSGISFFFFILGFVVYSYVATEALVFITLPIIPATVSLVTGLLHLVELIVIRKKLHNLSLNQTDTDRSK